MQADKPVGLFRLCAGFVRSVRIRAVYAWRTMQLVDIPLEVAIAQAKWHALKPPQKGARILAALNYREATKTELATRLGVSWNTVQSWIKGEKDCDWSRWMSITLALDLPETWEPRTEDDATKRRRN
jgi:DNA-binding XRE family transcriptional regulator